MSSATISVPPQLLLERILTLEICRVTERAAVSAARLRGHGNEKAADQAAVDAMRRELNKIPIQGTVVIGEGERDEAPMLFIGEKVGAEGGPLVDIAVDPLEGTTLCAKNMPGAIATMAMAEGGTLLNAPDVYMQKIAVGPGYPKHVVDLDAPPAENIKRLARAKDVHPYAITALVLDRPRHADIINAIRSTGAAVRLITDGDGSRPGERRGERQLVRAAVGCRHGARRRHGTQAGSGQGHALRDVRDAAPQEVGSAELPLRAGRLRMGAGTRRDGRLDGHPPDQACGARHQGHRQLHQQARIALRSEQEAAPGTSARDRQCLRLDHAARQVRPELRLRQRP